MNGRKRWPGRALAIMMSAILMVSSMGLTVFADEQIPGSSDAGVYEETAATGTEGSAQEDESFPGDGSVEEEQDIEEQGVSEETGDLSADEADDDHPAEDETADTGPQEDPASSADTESGDKGANEDIAQSDDDEIEEDIAQITENEAGKSAEQPSGETLGAAPDESEITTWAGLQEAFIAGGTVTLTQDVISSEENGDRGLYIPDGVSVTLNLGGHTLNMITSLPDPFDPEYDATEVIKVCGNLILEGEGTITGGSDGIKVDKSGSLTMNSGTVTGYDLGIRADSGSVVINGGTVTGRTLDGIRIFDSASLTMNGGTISGGSGDSMCISYGTFILHGGTITGNICLQRAVITLDRNLDDAARYRVYTYDQTTTHMNEEEAVITSGLSGNGSERNFVSCDEKFIAALDKDGEVVLAPKDSVAKYLERSWSGDQVVSKERARTATPFPNSKSVSGGWYYLNDNVTVKDLVSLEGDTNLILGDGFTLDVEGLYIPQGSTLTIYAQSDGENAGKIISEPDSGAAIGATSDNHPGGEIVIHGGNIEAKGAEHCAGIGSNDGNGTTAPITIYGGTITAKGGSDGAGIGGGRDCDGGEITIYGGEITAKGGGENGAGIGGGDNSDGGTITIYDGTITANKNPNEDGAGIGGGDAGKGGNITINGGTITTWSCDGAGIGGGDDGEGGTITINGGIITCNDGGSDSEAQGARIGGGCDADGGTTTITGGTIDVYFRDGAGIGGGENNDGGTINISGGTVTTHPNGVGNSAGIGGGNHAGDGGTITISGGTIWANSKNGAGIGGGRADDAFGGARNSGSGGTITISGGEVHAASAKAFGIGAGGQQGNKNYLDKPDEDLIGSAGTVTISKKADVYANGRLAGIGGDSGTINIEGGAVTVGGDADSDNGAGIYLIDKQGRVNISGGKVTATGNGKSSGIYTLYGIVTISGGEVNAAGGPNNGYGIGSYRDGVTYKLVLDYSDKTRDTIRITVDSYHANMMLNKDFICKSSGETFAQGEYMAQWPMAGKTIVASDSRPVLTINGVSDSFNDNIKLNYYFELPDEVLNDEGAYVEITNESAKKDPVTLPVKDVQYTEGKGYRFSIPLAAKEASDTITARAYDSQGNALTIIGNRYGDNYTETGVQSSMMEYFTWLEKNGKDDKEKAVGAAARDYCAAAQLYFGYHVTEGLAVSNAVDAVTADTLSSYIAGREGTLPSGVSIKGISAMLESDNTLRLYYGFKDVDPTTFTFTIDGDRVDLAERSDGMHYLTMKTGVWANKLHGDHTYTVSDGTNTYTITASVLTYARSCANKSDKKQSNLGKALYLYNQAAVAAFGN